jgi:hypothetical protein
MSALMRSASIAWRMRPLNGLSRYAEAVLFSTMRPLATIHALEPKSRRAAQQCPHRMAALAIHIRSCIKQIRAEPPDQPRPESRPGSPPSQAAYRCTPQ